MIVAPKTPEDEMACVRFIATKMREAPEDMVGDMPFSVLASVSPTGDFLGAVLYTNYRDESIEMSCAGTPGWMTKGNLRGFFGFPFGDLMCRRITGIVHRKNKTARKINERLGFKLEGVCRHGFKDGDAMIYGMIKKECRWI